MEIIRHKKLSQTPSEIFQILRGEKDLPKGATIDITSGTTIVFGLGESPNPFGEVNDEYERIYYNGQEGNSIKSRSDMQCIEDLLDCESSGVITGPLE